MTKEEVGRAIGRMIMRFVIGVLKSIRFLVLELGKLIERFMVFMKPKMEVAKNVVWLFLLKRAQKTFSNDI